MLSFLSSALKLLDRRRAHVKKRRAPWRPNVLLLEDRLVPSGSSLAPVALNDAYAVNEDQTLTVSPAADAGSLVMQSQPGDYIGQGQNYSYSSATGAFHATTNFDNGVSISYGDFLNPGVNWSLNFAAPADVSLTPGTYLNATRFPFQASNVPGLDVYGNGRGSNTLTGQFTVVQAVYGAGGQPERFDATFVLHSEEAAPALTGEINVSAAVSGVLMNDSDPAGNPLTAILVAGPQHGALNLNPDGSFTYAPDADFNGKDSFTYMASDGSLNSNVAMVGITVNPVNQAPTFVSGNNQTILEGAGRQAVPHWATAISAGPPNESGQTLNFIVSTTNRSLFAAPPAINAATGTLTYTPTPLAVGTAMVQVQLHDNGGTANGGSDTSAEETFTITLLPDHRLHFRRGGGK